MKLISNFELQTRNEKELSAMFCNVSKGLSRTKRDTAERRNALASLENISRARVQRLVMRPIGFGYLKTTAMSLSVVSGRS